MNHATFTFPRPLNPTRAVAALLVLLPAVAFAAPRAPAPLVDCVAPTSAGTAPFAVGEKIEFEIDSLGATVGSFSMNVLPGRGDTPYVILAKAKTGTFAANFYPVEAVLESRIGRKMESKSYVEDAMENGVRRIVELSFPAPKMSRMPVRATRDGTRADFTVGAPEDTRDMLSALYMVRSMKLPDGEEMCIPIFGAARIWALRAKVAGREKVRTPLGDVQVIHIAGEAVRSDYPSHKREIHFWLTDDAARVPVEAFGLIQNKPVRARMVSYDAGRKDMPLNPLR